MAESVPKEEFLRRLRASRRAWESALASIPSADLETIGFCGNWSAKDVVAHMEWYEQEMINILQQRAFVASDLWQVSADKRNAALRASFPPAPAQEALHQEAETYARLQSLLEALDEASFNDPHSFPPMPIEWKPWEVFAANTNEHYDDHLGQAKAFLDSHKQPWGGLTT